MALAILAPYDLCRASAALKVFWSLRVRKAMSMILDHDRYLIGNELFSYVNTELRLLGTRASRHGRGAAGRRGCACRPKRGSSPSSQSTGSLEELERLAAGEARQVAGEPHGVAHEEALDRRQLVDRRETDVADQAQALIIVREEAVEPVGHADQNH